MDAPKKVIVFGSTGFIGRCVVQSLLREGYHVVAVMRDGCGAARLDIAVYNYASLSFVEGSIDDDVFVQRVCLGADYIINLIGILYETPKQNFMAVHADFPARLSKWATQAGVQRLIHISAIGADVHAPARYAQSKGLGEEAARAHFSGITILRPSIVIGPQDSFFNRFAEMTNFMPMLPLIGGGHTQFQPVYVQDVVRAIIHVMRDQKTIGQCYELGGPERYSFKQLMAMLLQIMGRRRLLVPVPWCVAMLLGNISQILTNLFLLPPIITTDQVLLLRNDNCVSDNALSFNDLGLTPTPITQIMPTYLPKKN
ncbi:MAG: complex I NDUFA9 subunit family protein [Chitinophagia bacterium]|nr:complex I NDUFA9 subunit family protein [Chitinophagia bacterium]